ncbi:MAG: ABC transporter substrate-binding protein [Hyphomicrobiales bacterium]|nr:ABC transporter substrate-binding protein [Hyphomicrobiales bacterium]
MTRPSHGMITALAAAAALGLGAASAQETITVGAAATTSDAPIYIADRLGYFRDEGLTVKVTNFRSAADMVPMLGTGVLDAGAGSASAGLYNATVQGINIKIVADKASSPPGYGATKILIRADHIESGRFKALADLKGFRFAMNAPGVSNTATLNALLKSAGLRYSDVTTVNMPLPDHVAALGNKAVDAAASVEPAPTIAIRNKFAVLLKGDDEIIPNHQIAVLIYSEKFSRRTEQANRFMRAYLRAVRFYNGALQNGRLAGPNADKVIEILSASTPIKDPAIYKAITPTGMNPDGYVNIKSLADDLAFYREQGLIAGPVNVQQLVDHSFVEAAVKHLGPYRK